MLDLQASSAYSAGKTGLMPCPDTSEARKASSATCKRRRPSVGRMVDDVRMGTAQSDTGKKIPRHRHPMFLSTCCLSALGSA